MSRRPKPCQLSSAVGNIRAEILPLSDLLIAWRTGSRGGWVGRGLAEPPPWQKTIAGWRSVRHQPSGRMLVLIPGHPGSKAAPGQRAIAGCVTGPYLGPRPSGFRSGEPTRCSRQDRDSAWGIQRRFPSTRLRAPHGSRKSPNQWISFQSPCLITAQGVRPYSSLPAGTSSGKLRRFVLCGWSSFRAFSAATGSPSETVEDNRFCCPATSRACRG